MTDYINYSWIENLTFIVIYVPLLQFYSFISAIYFNHNFFIKLGKNNENLEMPVSIKHFVTFLIEEFLSIYKYFNIQTIWVK